MGSKNESSFTRACKTQAGRNGLILCFGSLSMFGMQNFANEANRIRMEMEREERDPHKR